MGNPKHRLMHYRAEPLDFDPDRTYVQVARRATFTKPVGFWVSVAGEDDWPSWCRSEEWGTDQLATAHEVRLSAGANIQLITSVDEIDRFDDEFAAPTDLDVRYSADRAFWGIDWALVAKHCDGVIIAPYLWERRHGPKCEWYYGWDCASGCIWNLAAIESVTVLSEVAQ